MKFTSSHIQLMSVNLEVPFLSSNGILATNENYLPVFESLVYLDLPSNNLPPISASPFGLLLLG